MVLHIAAHQFAAGGDERRRQRLEGRVARAVPVLISIGGNTSQAGATIAVKWAST